MKVLKNAGTFKLLATWPSPETNANAQMVMEKVGRICYQSEKGEITPETAQKFVTARIKTTHYAVIEHGWRGYIINLGKRFSDNSDLLSLFWPFTKYMYITFRASEILISANLETWRKIFVSGRLTDFVDISIDLRNFAPDIFGSIPFVAKEDDSKIVPITSVDQLSGEEYLAHIAHTMVYDGHSRGFTHELVRHRPPVYAQESTRYVDESDFEVVVPPHRENSVINLLNGSIPCSVDQWFTINEFVYKDLRKAGWRPEDARQVLPTAIKAQIAMTCNLEERRYIYFRRTASPAHWEIRRTMCNELKDWAQKTYPNIFDMFIYTDKPARDGIPGYCETTVSHDFFCLR